ncbi:MAG: DUF11 domain-containing protein [Sphingomonadales bacterium]|nr:DUF11 domain-containing protein [Sphingomonadales bacterium]
MKPFSASIAVAVALLCALLGLLVPQARAQAISNTAQAHWTVQGGQASASSNTVTFGVAPSPVTISTFVHSPAVANAFAFTPSRCGSAPLAVPGINGNTAIASLEQSTRLYIGDAFYFRLVAAQANRDPDKVDTLTTELVTSSGDRETITVYETGPDTGVFIGAMPTTAIPPDPVRGDCRLSVASGDEIAIHCMISDTVTPIAVATLDVLADPYGTVFDSEDGSAVDGARVTIVDAASGAPAQVFALDGVTPWPSTIVTGQPVIDGNGTSYALASGEYRFPLVRSGSYRLVVQPPDPYRAPSTADPAGMAGLKRHDGTPVLVSAPSFGAAFTVSTPDTVHIDIPVDRPPSPVSLTKTVSRAAAQPGDLLAYTLTVRNPDASHAKRDVVVIDSASPLLRLRPDSVRIDGVAHPEFATPSPDGHGLTVRLGALAPGQSRRVTYAMTVRADAPAGQAVNKAVATDSRGLAAYAGAVVRIEPDGLAARMTLIGRITAGGCAVDQAHPGVPGVRVMLEDGSYAVTDADGRYHFDGITPGDHVVQAIPATLPQGAEFARCRGSTSAAGSATSRFVGGQGGSLAVADFHVRGWIPAATPPSAPAHPAPARPAPGVASDREAAGGETDWLALGDGPNGFLFPAVDHNPRAPALRVVIRHRPGQTVELSRDGAPVDKVAFDGLKVAASRAWALSIWRGLPLERETTRLTAVIRNPDGSIADRLERDVHFNQTPAQVEIVPGHSRLVADGRTRPVLALRVLDRNGRPVHAGISGELALGAPYESAEALDAMQSRALSGLGRAAPHWVVKGDDGIALVELAPTMVSGRLTLDFTFADRDQQRHQTLEAWIVPGDLKWTLVGLAEGAVGTRDLADIMERTGRFDSDLGRHARVAFYAKGRVLGSLLTAAYDSARQKDDQRLLGALDPRAYYTVYADGATRRFDAASRERLYLRIEARKFAAMFGDYQTGFDQTRLALYQRTLTGVQAEGRFGRVHVQVFGARVAATHRRVEFQGGGVSGPYALGARTILANSETVTLEVRDRFRSEAVLSSTALTRFVDYDLDLLTGAITFKRPIQSRDPDLDPQFIVVEFDTDPALAGGGALDAGARVDWTSADGRLRVGATALSDKGDAARTSLQAIDLRARPSADTEIRAEAAVSETAGVASTAWLVEAEHHDRRLDLLAYARSVEQGFGTGNLSGAEAGRRKLGLTARYRVTEAFAISAASWHDESLGDSTRREAVQVKGEYRTPTTDLRLGVSTLLDHTAGGDARSTVVDAGATRRFLDNRLEVEASTSFGLGRTGSIDLPARHSLTARYALSPAVKLSGTYEIADGSAIDARTARVGLELQPWHGARAQAGIGRQAISEYGARSYAAFGLAQTLDVGHGVSLDATVDGNTVLGGFDLRKVVNPAHPVASGGQLDGNGMLAENFTALTLGATWRREAWAVTARGEWRDGELASRKGLTFGAIRQLGDGRVLGAGLTVTDARGEDGSRSATLNGAIAYATRPASSDIAALFKLEYRVDRVTAATAPPAAALTAGVAGTATSVFGGNVDAHSRRLVFSFSGNWSPRGQRRDAGGDAELVQRSEIGLFAAMRYNFDRYDGCSLAGATLLGGIDAHLGLGDRIAIGGNATIRAGLSDHTTRFSIGPSLRLVPASDVELTVGYNLSGYRDRDFSAARSTARSLFATLKAKFDAGSFGFLGLR